MIHRPLTAAILSFLTLALPAVVSAAPSYQSQASAPVSGFVLAGFALFVLAVLAVCFGFFVFWIMMLIDCARRTWPQKDVWLAVLIVSFFLQAHWLASLIYYFTVKRPNLGTLPSAPVTPPPAPPAV